MSYTPQKDRAKSFERLPEWAKAELHRLSNSIEYWQKKLAEGPEESDTFRWNGGLAEELDTPLGEGSVIRFSLGDSWHDRIDVRTIEGRQGKMLDVSAGGRYIRVHPSAANHVYITLDDR